MRIAIVTDAWEPQVNGVVRTLKATRAELEARGHDVLVVSPDLYPNLPCPTYPEIRLAVAGAGSVGERLRRFAPDHVHLSTEGPLCLAARRWCIRRGWRFTTAFHTLFPDYFAARTGIGADWVWPYFRWFHEASHAVMVATPSVRELLRDHGIAHSVAWSRGVDLSLFAPEAPPHPMLADLPHPIQLYVGRVAVEKNIEAFLATAHPGTKVVVGEGPARAALAARYPDVVFTGSLTGSDLAAAYTTADVFVFPSRTDTFGLVMIEALASGVPVAAFPVSGPVDIVTPATGALDNDLNVAIAAALARNRDDCALYGRTFSWKASVDQFVANLVTAAPPLARAA